MESWLRGKIKRFIKQTSIPYYPRRRESRVFAGVLLENARRRIRERSCRRIKGRRRIRISLLHLSAACLLPLSVSVASSIAAKGRETENSCCPGTREPRERVQEKVDAARFFLNLNAIQTHSFRPFPCWNRANYSTS